jgi:glycosyl transferase family 87
VRDRLLRDGFVILSVAFVAIQLFEVEPWAGSSVDAYAYWTTRSGDLYASADTGRIGAYLYSPAFAQLLAPITWLPLNVFTAIWTGINCAALWFLLRRWSLPSLLFLPIPFEIISGNVHLLYGVAIVIGFRGYRWAASWALMFLTKITPGIGVVWFLVRREWRSFAVAIGVTAAIVAVSYLLNRAAWEEWIAILQADLSGGAGQGALDTPGWYLGVPLVPRLIVAAGLAVVAGLTDRRWLIPFVVVLALPVVWLNGLAVLAAVVPLWQARAVTAASPGSTASAKVSPA